MLNYGQVIGKRFTLVNDVSSLNLKDSSPDDNPQTEIPIQGEKSRQFF